CRACCRTPSGSASTCAPRGRPSPGPSWKSSSRRGAVAAGRGGATWSWIARVGGAGAGAATSTGCRGTSYGSGNWRSPEMCKTNGDGHQHHANGHAHGKDGPAERVRVDRGVLDKNDQLAEYNRGWLAGRRVLALNLVSSPGAGK